MEENKFHLKVDKAQRPLFDKSFALKFLIFFIIGFAVAYFSSGKVANGLYFGCGLSFLGVLSYVFGHFFEFRYHILELEQIGENLEITYLDKRIIKHASVPVNVLLMKLGMSGRTASILESLTLYRYDIKGDTFILKQDTENGWTPSLIIDVFNHFCVYNSKLNRLPLTQEEIEKFSSN